MKRLFALLLLSLLLANLLGVYAFFGLRLYAIRQQMKAELRAKSLHELRCLKMSPSEFLHAQVEEDEIEWQGAMFDVAHMKMEEGAVLLYGVFDEKEDNLLSLLDIILKNSFSDEEPVPPGPEELLDFTLVEELQVPTVNIQPITKRSIHITLVSQSTPAVHLRPPRI